MNLKETLKIYNKLKEQYNLHCHITNNKKIIGCNNKFFNNSKFFMKDQQFDLLYLNLEQLQNFISFTVGQNSTTKDYKDYKTIEFGRTKLYLINF